MEEHLNKNISSKRLPKLKWLARYRLPVTASSRPNEKNKTQKIKPIPQRIKVQTNNRLQDDRQWIYRPGILLV